ncbi:MAG: SPOR domain-containing protein [Flavobacteriales bacterium]|nr:SPOR domain-containing protein [Flavobacteriales bacterium]
MLKTKSYIIIFFLLNVFVLKANVEDENQFQINFNIAKQHLSQRNILKALPYLNYLQSKYPDNENLKYLIGVCLAEENIVNPLSIQYLESATTMASLDYNPNSIDEERTPIYVFYYLCLAYAQNGYCDKAEEARQKFIEIYPYEDVYYIDNSKEWINTCKRSKEKPTFQDIPVFPSFKPYIPVEKELKPSVIENVQSISADNNLTITAETPKVDIESKQIETAKNIKTRRIEYSTKNPLYGVQLGAYKEVVPVSRFESLKNVDAFLDKQGMIRYVVGHFSISSQAKSLLDIIKEKGYHDAFVVDVNNEKYFSDEIISVDNINIRANPFEKLEYRIQLGAFKEVLPSKTADIYFKIEGITELVDDNYTYLTVGKYKTYDEAKAYLHGIKATGIKDAFVIALNDGKKISLQQAKNFYTK